jgi:hypothetical protein
MTLWDVVRIPFDTVRRGYREFRKALFTASRPSGEYYVVDESVDGIQELLGEYSFAPNWEFSYYKRGEVLNLARVVYEPHAVEGKTHHWWQTHVRGWRTDGGQLELHAHWELEPTENPSAHLDGVGFDFDRGMKNLEAYLTQAGIDHETTTVETDSSQEETDGN